MLAFLFKDLQIVLIGWFNKNLLILSRMNAEPNSIIIYKIISDEYSAP